MSSRPVLSVLAPQFESATGHKLAIVYGSIEPLRDRIAAGDAADVAISTRAIVNDLAGRGRIAPQSVTDVGRISIRLFVREGAPKPDIGTVDAVRSTLLAAESIAYTDPARGALAGRSFANALARMGIADQIKAKARIIPGLGDDVVAAVVRGEAAMGAGPANDVTPLPAGIAILGGLPKELDSDVLLSAGVLTNAPAPQGAAAFVKFLTSAAGVAAMNAHGVGL
jgi:molybdate transport system substrate-binding protein